MALLKAYRSGRTPRGSQEPPRSIRQPPRTSSITSAAPIRSASARTPGELRGDEFLVLERVMLERRHDDRGDVALRLRRGGLDAVTERLLALVDGLSAHRLLYPDRLGTARLERVLNAELDRLRPTGT